MKLVETIQALETGTTDSRTLVAEALDRAGRENPRLHAFLRMRAAAATTEAEAADAQRADGDTRPLLGIPIAVKDSHAIAGEPAPALGTTVSTAIASQDDPWVAALRSAGAIPIGQTTMPALALLPWGPARNPQDPTLMAGGSSSGSAAAVAAGIVTVGTASDGGGSIRIPAALCGLFGFKPSPDLVPGSGGWHGLSSNGVVTTTPADTAAVLDATGLACTAGSWAAALTPPTAVRIGWTDAPATPLGRPTRDVARALAEAVTVLQAAGHSVSEVSLPLADAAPALTARILRGAADERSALAATSGRVPLPQPPRLMTALGARVPRRLVNSALRRGEAIRARAQALDVDVLLTPTVWSAPRRQDDDVLTQIRRGLLAASRWATWTGPWNAAGLPAASVPLAQDEQGLPLAVQLIDLRGDGASLFGLAAQLLAAH